MAYLAGKREKGNKGNIKGIPFWILKGKREYTFRYSLFPLSLFIPFNEENKGNGENRDLGLFRALLQDKGNGFLVAIIAIEGLLILLEVMAHLGVIV